MADVYAAAVLALQLGVEAVDAAVNSTLPPNSLKALDSSGSSSSSSSSGGGVGTNGWESPAVGCMAVRQLMLCRHLLAGWLPPIAAQAAATAAAAAAATVPMGSMVLMQRLFQQQRAAAAAATPPGSSCNMH
jgi:hypothetical protein